MERKYRAKCVTVLEENESKFISTKKKRLKISQLFVPGGLLLVGFLAMIFFVRYDVECIRGVCGCQYDMLRRCVWGYCGDLGHKHIECVNLGAESAFAAL